MGYSATAKAFYGINLGPLDDGPFYELLRDDENGHSASTLEAIVNEIQGAERDLFMVEFRNPEDSRLPPVKLVTGGHHEYEHVALALRRTIVRSVDWGFEPLDALAGDPTPDEIAKLTAVYQELRRRIAAVGDADEIEAEPTCCWMIGGAYG